MFSNLLYIIFVMLIIALTPMDGNENSAHWEYAPKEAFWIGLAAYACVLFLIFFQARKVSKKQRRKNAQPTQLLVNLELLAFLFFYHFHLGASRAFESLPWFPQTLMTITSLFFYFAGLTLFHYVSAATHKRYSHAAQEIRLLIPFIIPFLLLTLFLECIAHFSSEYFQFLQLSTIQSTLLFLCMTFLFLGLMMIFLPAAIQKIWQCQPLEESPLKDRLEHLCQKANFKHAGLQTWTILNHSLTAAIIGIAPRFRYVMFTKKILNEMPPESIEAVLAHEIGHNYRKHLLIYPFIIFGISVLMGLFSLFAGQALENGVNNAAKAYPTLPWNFLAPIIFLFPLAVIVAVYFRVVFGFFSRLFERQADLHVFELQIPAEHLINALDNIGIATGNSHRQPNWHHFSIQERIDFLNAAMKDPSLIKKHHHKVRWFLIGYFILLIGGLFLLFYSNLS